MTFLTIDFNDFSLKFSTQYFNNAVAIINSYDGNIPLHHYLKNYFSLHKKFGSRDRKVIAHFCYCYYRLGKALINLSPSQRLKIAIFLCNNNISQYGELFDEHWMQTHSEILKERINFIQKTYTAFDINSVFDFINELPETVDRKAFAASHFIQPLVFLRIRPNKEEIVLQKLKAAEVAFTQISENCISVEANTKIDTVLLIDKDVIIQDLSSQKVKYLFEEINQQIKNHQIENLNVWDCCAASGGKSILVYDTLPNIKLTVSDVRESILQNLTKRFAIAGIRDYTMFQADLTIEKHTNKKQKTNYDLIICDAPCSGSGTWGRTPEQLYFFTNSKIEYYAALQKKIMANAVKQLKQGGHFLYITCSVFTKENEEAVAYAQQKLQLKLIKKELIQGYERRADSMFAALFEK